MAIGLGELVEERAVVAAGGDEAFDLGRGAGVEGARRPGVELASRSPTTPSISAPARALPAATLSRAPPAATLSRAALLGANRFERYVTPCPPPALLGANRFERYVTAPPSALLGACRQGYARAAEEKVLARGNAPCAE
ncbi:MAG TPA: hypothetical protein VFS43_17050 [Polyangiaceae bacterium]|nr:hypothetical protein [Polyangiaceae bacterium]